MFDKIKKPKFPVTIKVGKYSVDLFDEMKYKELNELAGHLYTILGYQNLQGFDYYCSNHPQERNMFSMAVVSKWFSEEFGL